ncbi:MAG: hypothetical protein GXO27_01685, partial [Chlorobi bacterium]|nr:hypothetical protein [Chlorobiota bacterium]
MEGFLHKLADEILAVDRPDRLHIVFPNRRPASFLRHILAERAKRPVISPQMWDLPSFFARVTGLERLTSYEALLFLYEAYVGAVESRELTPQDFQNFMGWAPLLMRDLDEIDKDLISPSDIFEQLREIARINEWDPQKGYGQPSDYLKFMESLEEIYRRFTSSLEAGGLATDGMLFRRAASTLSEWKKNFESGSLLFAGFNVLTRAEKQIFERLVSDGIARMRWDLDRFYLEEPFEAGYFYRRRQKERVLTGDTLWIFDALKTETSESSSRRKPLSIKLVQAPSDQSQVQYVVDRLLEIEHSSSGQPEARRQTLVVITDTNLFRQFLHALPPELEEVNITYALPLRYTEIYELVAEYLDFYKTLSQKKRVHTGEFLDLVRRGLFPLPPDVKDRIARELTGQILQAADSEDETTSNREGRGVAYRRADDFFEWWQAFASENFPLGKVPPYFGPVKSCEELLERLSVLVRDIIERLEESDDVPSARRARLLAASETQTLVKRMRDLNRTFIRRGSALFEDAASVLKFFRILADEFRLGFRGMPLEGYHVMELMETRLLDFRRVFFLGANEGMLPPRAGRPTFIPYDVRKALNLPLPEERSAATAYLFYRLISRAEEVEMVYNANPSASGKGQASRYAWQLQEWSRGLLRENERNELKPLKFEQYFIEETPSPRPYVARILKDSVFSHRVGRRILSENGVSPSFLSAWLYRPDQFFFRYVLGWKDSPVIETEIGKDLLGRVVHETMETLYRESAVNTLLPESAELSAIRGVKVTPEDVEKLLSKADEMTERIFLEYLKGAGIQRKDQIVGKNLFLLAKAKYLVRTFLEKDKNFAREGLEILSLEQKISIPMEVEGIGTVTFQGRLDRIDRVNGMLRVVDYKTGTSDIWKKNKKKGPDIEKEPVFSVLSEIKSDNSSREKTLQLLFYAWILRRKFPDRLPENIRALIYGVDKQASNKYLTLP